MINVWSHFTSHSWGLANDHSEASANSQYKQIASGRENDLRHPKTLQLTSVNTPMVPQGVKLPGQLVNLLGWS